MTILVFYNLQPNIPNFHSHLAYKDIFYKTKKTGPPLRTRDIPRLVSQRLYLNLYHAYFAGSNDPTVGAMRRAGKRGREPIRRYETCQREPSLQIALKPAWHMSPW